MNEKTKRRLSLQRTYGKWYKRHLEAGGSTCFYCGEQRICLDHRPPLETVDTLGVERLREVEVPLCLIPCCNDCNGRLGARPLLTALDAVKFLREALENLYEKRASLWSRDELKEMSPMFRALIKKRLEATEILLCRVQFLQKRELDTDLMPVWEPSEDSQYD